MTQVTFYGKTADEAAAEYLAKRNNELDALRNIMQSKMMVAAALGPLGCNKEPSGTAISRQGQHQPTLGKFLGRRGQPKAIERGFLYADEHGAFGVIPSATRIANSHLTDKERTRILAHLDSMEPGRLPYTRASAEFERRIERKLWERIRAAVESGEEPPKSDDVHLAVNRASGASAAPTVTAAPQTPSGLTTIAAIGAKKWGA